MKEVRDTLSILCDNLEHWKYKIETELEEFQEEIERIMRMIDAKTTKPEGEDLI